MNNSSSIWGLVLLLMAGLLLINEPNCYAQSRKKLEKRKKSLFKDIDLTKKLLLDTRKERKQSANEIGLLNQQIDKRKEVIETIEQELGALTSDIDVTQERINTLEQKLSTLKEEYAKLIKYAYLNKNAYHKLMFLFSAKDFNDAYRRFKYMKYYNEHRKNQFQQIQSTQDTLTATLNRLEVEKADKNILLEGEEAEKTTLEEEKSHRSKMISQLKSREGELKNKLTAKEKAAQALDKQIEEIIRKALMVKIKEEEAKKKAEAKRKAAAKKKAAADARRKARAEAAKKKAKSSKKKTANKSKKSSSTNVVDTKTLPKKSAPKVQAAPQADWLSNSFASNKGRLPWPVDEGVITEKFGTNRHPVLTHLTTKNNGINIATRRNAQVRALFDGEITNILHNPSFQWAVIVRHGDYFTVYSQLQKVLVKKGQTVTTKQAIGIVHTNKTENKTEVHLEVWKSGKKQNPIRWIYRK